MWMLDTGQSRNCSPKNLSSRALSAVFHGYLGLLTGRGLKMVLIACFKFRLNIGCLCIWICDIFYCLNGMVLYRCGTGSLASTLTFSDDTCVNAEWHVSDIHSGGRKDAEKNVSKWHFVYHKSLLDFPGCETGPLCEKPATNRLIYGSPNLRYRILFKNTT
jgi:hypothetical protein